MKKISVLQFAKDSFRYDDEGMPILNFFGQFMVGLTEDEIKDYLRVRANKGQIETIYKKFCKIAGINTMAVYQCSHCKKTTCLMYRHDVERFANVLFNNESTYFD